MQHITERNQQVPTNRDVAQEIKKSLENKETQPVMYSLISNVLYLMLFTEINISNIYINQRVCGFKSQTCTANTHSLMAEGVGGCLSQAHSQECSAASSSDEASH